MAFNDLGFKDMKLSDYADKVLPRRDSKLDEADFDLLQRVVLSGTLQVVELPMQFRSLHGDKKGVYVLLLGFDDSAGEIVNITPQIINIGYLQGGRRNNRGVGIIEWGVDERRGKERRLSELEDRVVDLALTGRVKHV